MSRTISARNLAITRRALAGEACQTIAQDYVLSGERVKQIAVETARRLSGWYALPPEERRLHEHWRLTAWRQYHACTPLSFEVAPPCGPLP